MKYNNLLKQYLIVCGLVGSNFIYSQTVAASNTNSANCYNCIPTSWTIGTGTPDKSTATVASTNVTPNSGGGASWVTLPNGGTVVQSLPLPPNRHTNWVSLRDLGTLTANEESVGVPLQSLTTGRTYEVFFYSLSGTTNQTGFNNYAYAGKYIDTFTATVDGAGNGQQILTTTQNAWQLQKSTFTATGTTNNLTFGARTNAVGVANTAAGFLNAETVQISLTANAINGVPTAVADNTTTFQNSPITINVTTNDTDAGGAIAVSTVDLDTTTAGIQNTITTSQGTWTVNNLGDVTFVPLPTFVGIATLPYMVQDNFTLPETTAASPTVPVNVSRAATSNAATITVTVTDDTDGDGIRDDLDLDDDNDGILDSVEGQCATTSVAATDGFDNPVVTTINGNNIQSSNPYNGWTADGLAANAFNIVRVNGAGYTEGPDNAQSGNQYVDINGNSATIYKQFTFATATVLSASAWFANRATANAGYVAYSTRIEILNTGSNTVVAQGNLLNFTKAQGDEGWFQSSVSNVVLPAGTYRIRMFVSDFGHVDTISYCFSTDTDADGIPNHLDPDSDGDGCADALEGSETVRYNQVYPLNFATTSLRGQIRVLANGVTTGTPSQVISTVAAANGVPLLVNNSVNNTGAVAGLADNTDGTVDVGQSVGTSQNSAARDAECDRCFRTATTTGTTLATNHGITALSRAGVSNGNWPMKITSAYTALDAKTKGLVINRLTTTQVNAITAPVVGMMVYDTTVNCLKIYDSTNAWRCFSTQTCDNFNQ